MTVAEAADPGQEHCADRLRDLDREGPDAPGRAVDEDSIAGLDATVVTQPLEGGDPGDGETSGLLERANRMASP